VNTSTIKAVKQLSRAVEKMEPGMPAAFTAACAPGDRIPQGDMYITVIDPKDIPEDYVKCEHPGDADRQLVVGNTQGSRHCLDSLAGVVLYQPPEWGDMESLRGPAFTITKERKVLHPVHGDVTVAKGLTVRCDYQRVWDAEQKKTRRAQD